MQLAMHNWMRPEPIAVTLRRLAKCRYDSLEIAGLPDEYDTTDVARLLDESGLSCWGGVTMMENGLSLISADESVRARSVAYVKDVVTLVKELDGRVVTVVPGEIGNPDLQATPDDEWRWAVESMRESHDYATPAGIRLAIEPINRCETHFINRIEQALALADAVGADCGVCPDTFHLNIEERDPLEAILEQAIGSQTFTCPTATNSRVGWGTWTGRASSRRCAPPAMGVRSPSSLCPQSIERLSIRILARSRTTSLSASVKSSTPRWFSRAPTSYAP
jgi:hydroxypyruvate isomerase